MSSQVTSQSSPSPAALDMLRRNALRLLNLVDGLLNFVRIEAGKHHSTIAVRSKKGCGTVFRIFLPLDTTKPETTMRSTTIGVEVAPA